MKPYLLLLIAIALFAACGKEESVKDLCEGVNCQIGAECIDGICIVTDSCAGVTCGIGAGCYQGSCIDSLVGNYHWVGSSQTTAGNISYPPIQIDDTRRIARYGDSILTVRGYDVIYTTSPDTVYIFFARFNYGYASAKLTFNRPYNDTAYYYYQNHISAGGIESTSLTGVKIH